MQGLIEHAEAQGLRVLWRDLGRRNGVLTPSGLVVLNPCRTETTQRLTLAHEIGHWHHGHDWTRTHDVERDERQADLYAARLLIDPIALEQAAAVHGGHPGAIARELGITTRLVVLWAEHRRVAA